jgi:type I restriction enzyme M protein
VPDGIMNRSNDKKLRDFILEQCEIDAVISLPLNTFFTTNKKTYILALTKKNTTISQKELLNIQ